MNKTSFVAGCGKVWETESEQEDLAYLEQAFPECPSCVHRVEPKEAKPFCLLRKKGAAHPFAGLARLLTD